MRRPREWFRQYFDAAYVVALREEKPPRQTRREVDFVLGALGPAKGARILDVPCGYGRHARELARRGFQVVGVDLSRPMIAEARRRGRKGPRLRFRRGDIRRIAFREEFDAVVNLYTSFGYFSPAQNRAALRRMARALRPGGRILIDHRDPIHDSALPGRLWYRTGPKRFVLEDRRFDRRRKIVESTQLIVTSGRRWVVRKHLRLQEFSLPEWRRMLRGVGLRFIRAYGGYDGRPYRPASTGRLIVVGERARR
jgi:SAM-dependent methyltransferase